MHLRRSELSVLYAMQRANGDWFALDDHGGFRVPVFRTSKAAMVARSRDSGMECFRPVVLDERGLKGLLAPDGSPTSFWLVTDPLMNLKRGQPLDVAQFTFLIRGNSDKVQSGENATSVIGKIKEPACLDPLESAIC